MHEVAVALRIVEIALRAADEHGGGRIVAAHLDVGELTCITPEALAFAFRVAARGTRAEGCRLDIVKVPARIRCHSCKAEHERELLEACPQCNAVGGEILAGRELRLDTIEIDETQAASSGVFRDEAIGDG